ncbi:MAG: hypothetical protein M1818_004297 [Claussenomyces sp. TS43310]|nr:MAG: hypothetical protein M1818_004297 [Claussenomyces sp. TS43310]
MTSTYDVAIGALNEVASNARSESNAGEAICTTSGAEASSQVPDLSRMGASSNGNVRQSVEMLSSSTNNSQTTAGEFTTAATSEDFSSQSRKSPSELQQLSQLTTTQPSTRGTCSNGLRSPPVLATNAGQKRTRDGFTKTSASTSSGSPTVEPTAGHSRNTSNVSITSSVASAKELTSELRTRLSYAMVKVNNGWESLPIEEVESLASQAGSPTSSSSTMHGRRHFYTSPRVEIANSQGLPEDPRHSNLMSLSASAIDPVLYGDNRSSRTYESFWREQSHKQAAPSADNNMSHRSLAPPADIRLAARLDSNSFGTHTLKYSAPLNLRAAFDLSKRSNGSNSDPTPHTPSRSQPTDDVLQTPTQKSIQEQDAIETLLFMSSPGNSSMGQAFPQSQGQTSQVQSPLRTEFGAPLHVAPGRRIEFPEARKSRLATLNTSSRRRIPMVEAGKLGEDEFDKLLDSMADESSDEEIEIPMTPRRLATSNV